MSWYDALEAGELTSRPADYASKRFGVSIDRISISASAGTPLPEVLAAVDKSTADVVVLRYPAREATWFATLAAGPRTALLADRGVTGPSRSARVVARLRWPGSARAWRTR